MKVLITGAGGLFGSAMATLAFRSHEVFSAFNSHPPSVGTPIRADLSRPGEASKLVTSLKPDLVVHAAALTDVDRCEVDRDLAERVNSDATREIAMACEKTGAFLVFISTDYVFNGAKGAYTEEDKPSPVNFYGMTKLKGEESVSSAGAGFAIARASVIYGATPGANKTNSALWLIDKLARRERPAVLVDQFVSPTLNTNMAEMVLEIGERRFQGLFHVSGSERVSRLGFAQKLCGVFGLDARDLNPVEIQSMSWRARRPRDSSLDVSKAKRLLRSRPLGLIDSLIRLKREMNL